MQGVLSPSLALRQPELARAYLGADPFPHVVIDDFFSSEFCRRLIEEFPEFERGDAMSELGTKGRKATIEDVRGLGGAFAEADDVFRAREFAELIGSITGIPGLLYDPDYIGGGTHENLAGQELDPHVDFNYHPKTGWHRRLNLIVYLNSEWQIEWGGALELHLDPWLPADQNRIKTVLPLANRAVLFETSERSWHGFQAVEPPRDRPDLSRRSLALYMYTTDRPAAETAPPHATVYVQRPLPSVVRPDSALSLCARQRIMHALTRRREYIAFLCERDLLADAAVADAVDQLLHSAASGLRAEELATIEGIVRRQDSLIKQYYEREKQLSSELAELGRATRGPRTPQLPIASDGLVAKNVEGMWADMWVSRRLGFVLETHVEARRLTIHGLVPAALADGQSLVWSSGGTRCERHFPPGEFSWDVPFHVVPGDVVLVELTAGTAFCPASSSASTDDRELAFVVTELSIA